MAKDAVERLKESGEKWLAENPPNSIGYFIFTNHEHPAEEEPTAYLSVDKVYELLRRLGVSLDTRLK